MAFTKTIQRRSHRKAAAKWGRASHGSRLLINYVKNGRRIRRRFYALWTNCSRVRFASLTRSSITGTSVSTPTVVASAAGEVMPNRAMATATAS